MQNQRRQRPGHRHRQPEHDLRSTTSCLTNGIRNGIQADGSYAGFSRPPSAFARAYDMATGRRRQLFDDHAFGRLSEPDRGQPDLGGPAVGRTTAPSTVCQQDRTAQYDVFA
jgi:hypothetical protein